jgi:uncharacterized protein (TIGR02145 family)
MKKLKLYWFCIALIAIVFAGCQKDEDDSTKVTASFTVDQATGDNPLLVNFTNTSTNAVSYKWKFGDGANSAVNEPNHSFTNSSTTSEKSYTVTLIATAADNSTDSCNQVITVNKNRIIFNPNLTYGNLTDQEGNVYKTITIGTQTWMAENLRVTKYRNGDPIVNVTGNAAWTILSTGACCSYGNTDSNDLITLYGRLYNWFAVTDSRSIAPEGWHVPTDGDWTTLTNFLGGESVAAGKMKETGISHWAKPNTNATNESGFSALPSGSRYSVVGTFNEMGTITYLWSSTNYDAAHAWNRFLNIGANCNRSMDFKTDGYPVRLVKD